MASKAFVVALLCVAFVTFVQSAPQYAVGEDPTYDDEDEERPAPQANTHASNDEAVSEEDFDPSELSTDFPTANDPGRHFGEENPRSEAGSTSSE